MTPMLRPYLMAGGRGTRLWPLSLSAPKPLLPLLPGGRTPLEETMERLAPLAPPDQWILGTGAADVDALAAGLRAGGAEGFSSLVEPGPRDTAPALLYLTAALASGALAGSPDDLVLAAPLDHRMGRPEEFRGAVRAGMPLAEQGNLVTFGIRPSGPATGYGYLELGEGLGGEVSRVARFTEKPDAATAEEFVAQGHLWNSGVFLFQAGAMAAAAASVAPALWEAVQAALAAAADPARPGPEFLALKRISFDYAIAQAHPRVAAVACDPAWRDLGTWDQVAALLEEEGGSLAAAQVEVDAAGNVAIAPGQEVAFVGVEGLVLVAGPDGLLVCRRSSTQGVREVPGRLDPEP